MWEGEGYTAVWEYSDVGGGRVYRCGNTVMWEKRGVGT